MCSSYGFLLKIYTKIANVVSTKDTPLENYWGFVDGMVRPIYRPGKDQRIIYSGYKKKSIL